jgi:hypothetical protein
MRFIIIHRTNAHWESGAIPDQALIGRVEALIGEMVQAGVLRGAEGLGPSSEGFRLRFAGGERTIIPGPFEGENELEAGFTIVHVASRDEAIEWATRQANIVGDGEVDIRLVHEPWDIGIGSPPPGNTPRRYMVLRKATPATEADTSLTSEARSRLSQLIDETTQNGVHVATETMRPSRRGRRFTNTRDGRTYHDGPFIETKELLGGYVIVEAGSLGEASRWVPRYMDAVGADPVDVRELEHGVITAATRSSGRPSDPRATLDGPARTPP